MGKNRRKIPWNWLAPAGAAFFLVAAGKFLPIGAWLQGFGEWISGLGSIGGVLYGVFYVIAVLLFVPGLPLTLGAGYLFGFLRGTILVSVASTAAAALAFLIARHLARSSIEKLARKYITLKAARGHSYASVELAIQWIASGKFPLELLTTHHFGLDGIDLAIKSTGGTGLAGAIHVTVLPWGATE